MRPPLLVIIILMATFDFCKSQSGCVLVDNIMFMYRFTNTSANIQFGFPSFMKWVAVGINNNNTKDGALIYMYYENQLSEYHGIGLTKPLFIRQLTFQKDTTPTPFYDILIRFDIPLNSTAFNFTTETFSLLVAYNTEVTPISPIDFEKHTAAFSKRIKIFDPNSDISFKYRD